MLNNLCRKWCGRFCNLNILFLHYFKTPFSFSWPKHPLPQPKTPFLCQLPNMISSSPTLFSWIASSNLLLSSHSLPQGNLLLIVLILRNCLTANTCFSWKRLVQMLLQQVNPKNIFLTISMLSTYNKKIWSHHKNSFNKAVVTVRSSLFVVLLTCHETYTFDIWRS